MAQICKVTDSVYEEARAKFTDSSRKYSSKPPQLDVEDLVNLIVRQAGYLNNLLIIIDGVNESSSPVDLLEALKEILSAAAGVQLLISSINEKGIENSMKSMPNICEITISPGDIRNDVSLIIYSALRTHPRLKKLPQDLKDDVIMKLTNGAKGM